MIIPKKQQLNFCFFYFIEERNLFGYYAFMSINCFEYEYNNALSQIYSITFWVSSINELNSLLLQFASKYSRI